MKLKLTLISMMLPFISIGWDSSFGKNKTFGFFLEAGAAYRGTPKVEFTADGTAVNDATFQSELAKEEENLKDALDRFTFYPVISIGASYRF